MTRGEILLWQSTKHYAPGERPRRALEKKAELAALKKEVEEEKKKKEEVQEAFAQYRQEEEERWKKKLEEMETEKEEKEKEEKMTKTLEESRRVEEAMKAMEVWEKEKQKENAMKETQKAERMKVKQGWVVKDVNGQSTQGMTFADAMAVMKDSARPLVVKFQDPVAAAKLAALAAKEDKMAATGVGRAKGGNANAAIPSTGLKMRKGKGSKADLRNMVVEGAKPGTLPIIFPDPCVPTLRFWL